MIRNFLIRLHRDTRGTVAVTFLLALPIFLWIICIMTQYALMVNARMGVNRAVMAAGRSAVTSFPTDPEVDYVEGVANVHKAACMALEPLSPKSPDISDDAQNIVTAMENLGITVPASFAARYSYAQGATSIEWIRVDANDIPIPDPDTWQPIDFAQNVGQRIRLTVHYKFHINVPVLRNLPGFGTDETVAGITGKFFTMSSSYIVQLTHGREAGVNNAQ